MVGPPDAPATVGVLGPAARPMLPRLRFEAKGASAVNRPSPAPTAGRRCAGPWQRGDPLAVVVLSSKSKTSKFSCRRAWLDALGTVVTAGWSSSQRSATWPALLPCASPISFSVASFGTSPWASGE